MSHSSVDAIMDKLDETQVKLMKEECILIDNDDHIIGSASKKACHLVENIDRGMLHRAFSVFLFNEQGKLLLQQRSSEKITFPDHWTNTCCSHPLNFAAELDETESIGVRRAAQRKLQHELGIKPHEVPLDSFQYLTRIHYRANNVPYDGIWAEHEIDYILFVKRDVTVEPNINEVKSHRYVTQAELKDILDKSTSDGGLLVTPWFRLIVDNFLWKWWNNLDDLSSSRDPNTIHRMC